MVAAVVLDIEVPVAGLRQGDLGQPALQRLLLVPHFVRGVDPDATQGADRQRQADLGRPTQRPVVAQPAQVRRGEQVGTEHHAEVLERNEQVSAVAVVLVVLQPLHHVVGRILAVGPESQVKRRQHDVQQDRADPEQHLGCGVPAELVHPPHDRQDGDEQRRDDQPHQPEPALLVLPHHRVLA